MEFSRIRRSLALLRNTPLHPQWLVFREEKQSFRDIALQTSGVVLDIGCGQRRIENFLPPTVYYIGLDYYLTATRWYRTKPHVFGDAIQLPFANNSIDCVLLLDVLEHIRNSAACLTEIKRVLRPGGTLILHVPFLYPIHDAPLDFQRWTIHGLRELLQRHGMSVDQETSLGHPLESAALNANLAFSHSALSWIERRHYLAVLSLLLPPFVLISNLLARLISHLSPSDDFMPYGYKLHAHKDH